MKLSKNLGLIFLIFIGSETSLFAGSQDKVNVFLQEFIDGKPINEFIHFELIIYSMSEKEGNKWLLTEETFSTIEDQKYTTVNLSQTRSNDDYTTPYIKDVKWVPGKKLKCTYEPYNCGMDVKLTAKKGNGGKYDWDVYCVGSYKINDVGTTHKWEFKSTRNTTLEFNKLQFQAIYYRKDEKGGLN